METFDWNEAAKAEWDNRAGFWRERSQTMWERGSRKDIIPFMVKHVAKGSTILDIGCGDGYGTYKLRQLGYDVIGADISVAMIEKAKEQLPKEVPLLQADIGNLPLAAESVDGIMCINVVEWTEIPAHSLKELRSILRKGGLLCIGILGPTAGPRASGYRRVYGEKTISHPIMPWELHKLAKEMKFELRDSFGVYKDGVTEKHYKDLSIELKQALSFMWVFMFEKVGD
ncbi:class I SAM-dependent methyltransferase [Ornithinibacillus contaminans]|uniref:class I SAM-dependent methyltransferase n=1 Tax=Ornithinibacillus contaminans TaxID=694055 RepID=UPI00064DBFC5|nr:class I SAM-dependent methyltransferase [Ornithinibacillus contaminans]